MKKNLLFILFIHSLAFAYAPTNFYRPHEVDFRTYEWKRENTEYLKQKFHKMRFGVLGEYGDTTKCRDWDENKEGVLQLYNQTESSVAMLLGAPECAPHAAEITALARSLGVSAATATDNDCRGRFCLTGEYEEYDFTFFGRYRLPISLDGVFELSLFVPVKSMKFDDVCWRDLTCDVLTEDKEFKEDISGKLAQRAMELGNLDINASGWSKCGLGDAILMLGWQKDFPQTKDYLKSVRVNAQVGVSVPIGEKRDVDQSLSLPLGNDGAWGMPANLGLDLSFIHHLRAGIDLSFFALFDTSGTYRMKTSRHQTDFLLLHKGEATKSQGATWKFTLYGQARKLYFKGLSAMVSYHFLKHDEDRLSPKSYNFDYSIINTAQSLKEWNSHSFVFQVAYDPRGVDSNAKSKPHISFFYKLPVAGKRVILADTFGAQIGFTW